jgi:hypothetical protein
MSRRAWIGYLVASAALALALFRGALWGERLLAPLDIAPALLAKYRWLAPEHSGVPANHYTIDQLTYDLPLQRTIYAAYRAGEVPWWDPYTFGGRPLLADAHINGTDPVRLLCYLTLPFEPAYNWTLILHWWLGGLGLFVLLRRWRFGVATSVGLALAGQCAGYQAIFFGHPWNAGAFLFYPWLWLAWDAWLAERRWWAWPLGGLAVAGVFYAGNIQSHAYVVVFALAFLVGQGGLSWREWRRTLPVVAGCGVLGACLAAPVLAAQIEFYRLSVRPVPLPLNPVSWLSGLASLTAFHPWALGTFRSLDLSKVFGQYALGFVVFIGSAAVALAALGAARGRRVALRPAIWRVAVGLGLAYLAILSTPLQAALYTRSAGLAVLGLIVLAGLGLEFLRRETAPLRAWGWSLAALALATTLALNLMAFVIYPRLLPRVRDAVLREAATRSALTAAPALREFQVNNLPREISVRNPETALATAGLLAVAALCLRPDWRRRPGVWPVLLALNLAPGALFYARFIANQPIAGWRHLEAGGPEQRRVATTLDDDLARLREVAPGVYDQVFPNCLGHLQRVRVLHGYSALVPRCFANLPESEQAAWADRVADATYTTPDPGLAGGRFETNRVAAPASFQWRGGTPRAFRAELVSLNEQRVTLEPGPAGTLLWTDTAYPGWRATLDNQPVELRRVEPCFSAIEIPAGAQPAVLRLRYQPTGLGAATALALSGVALLGVAGALARRAAKRPAAD